MQHKLSFRELEKLSGISKSVINDIAIGIKTKLTIKQEDGFCNAFKCKKSDLYEKDDYYDKK